LQALKFGEATLDIVNQEFKCREKASLRMNTKLPLLSFKESIIIDGVAFRYKPSLPYLFTVLNLKINKGDSVGICGKTGSGKSSFLNLVLGFLNPTSGTIKIDGHDIHQNNMSLKHVLGYVPQDIFLLEDSIANNIAFGEGVAEIDRKRVLWALNEAQMGAFIKKQRMGIDTHVGERGVRLSGGQKQRLGIARALYFGAKILIFDEATSALDEATERAVMNNIAKLKNKYTLIVVAHRLSTLKVCDRIYTLSEFGLIASELD
jgi:ATP-binding cassette, subfamily B, bacterial PglK